MPDNLGSAANIIWNYYKGIKYVGPTSQYENGAVALPALALGASTTLAVPLSGTFNDTNYIVKVRAVAGSTLLAMIQVTNAVKATNSVNVTVKANGLASGAGILLVDCFRSN